MRFLDVKTDYAFKKVFGSENSKDILISFLNSIVYDNSDRKIKDLTIVDPYNIPLIDGMKDTYVDVKAILDDNSKVIIEMQVLNVPLFEKRILYNAAKNYSIQLEKGEDYSLLNPVIALTIADFVMFDEFDEFESRFKLIEKDKFITYNDDIELVFIELPKFKKELNELKDIKDKWIYFIKNVENLEYVPETFQTKPLQKAFDIANTACMSAEELEAQHKRKDFIWLKKGALELAEERGLQKGFEKGIEKGLKEGIEKGIDKGLKVGELKAKIEIAKNMLKQNLDLDTISNITGLDIKTIKTL
jgi:predicted transposase/invertase (TIGR01784 family)